MARIAGKLVRVTLRRRPGIRCQLGVVYLVRRPRPAQKLVKLFQRIGPQRSALPPNHYKTKRAVERRQLRLGQPTCQFFGKTKAGNGDELPVAIIDVVLDVDFAIPDHDRIGKLREFLTNLAWNEFITIEAKPS